MTRSDDAHTLERHCVALTAAIAIVTARRP
jgi:hypothetical protein